MLFTPNHGWGKVKEVSRSYLNKSFFLHFLHPWKLVCSACYDQCITIRQRTTRYPFVHPNALFLCTFFAYFTLALFSCFLVLLHVALASCRTFSVLHSFRIWLYPYLTLSMTLYFFIWQSLAVFSSSLFSCCTLFMLHLFVYCTALTSCCTFFILHSFQVSLFLCCTLFVLHFSKSLIVCLIKILKSTVTKKVL